MPVMIPESPNAKTAADVASLVSITDLGGGAIAAA